MTASQQMMRTTCPGCHQKNQPEMLFCIHCGQPLVSSSMMGNACPRCGRFDELSVHFCIYCAADTKKKAGTAEEMARFSWEIDHPGGTMRSAQSASQRLTPPTIPLTVTAILIGTAFAAACAFLMAPSLVRAAAQDAWSNGSLTLYTTSPDASFVVAPYQDARMFTLGRVGSLGSIKLTDLLSERYLIRLQAPKHKTLMIGLTDQLKVSNDRPTAVGIPDKIELPLKSSDSKLDSTAE